jgi:hypothetical protein
MKKAKRVLAALLLGLGCSAPAIAADPQGDFTSLGQGTVSCANWTGHRKAGDWSPLGAWILGYLTAVNQFVWKGQDIADKNKVEELYSWMDGYCGSHPQSDLTAGAGQLLVTLTSEHEGAVLQNQLGR